MTDTPDTAAARLQARIDKRDLWGIEADLRAVLAEHQQMRETLWRMIDDDPCDYDHHGYCQTHRLSEHPCSTAEARRLVGEWQPAPADTAGRQDGIAQNEQ